MRRLTTRIDYAEAREELEGFMQGNAMASFVHLHFGSNPTVAPAFVERCKTNTTKAAAVAAASASAVAGAGPAAAAAAGAAAAAAVAAALGEQQQPQQLQSPSTVKLVRSGSELYESLKVEAHRRSSFSEYSESMQSPNGNSYLVRVAASSLQGNRKVNIEEGNLGRPRNGKKYSLDVNRQQLSTRVGKPLNGKRLPERIVSLLPAATEILVEIGKLIFLCCFEILRDFGP
jgi:hypothetical protein